jgi:hypothetical protein
MSGGSELSTSVTVNVSFGTYAAPDVEAVSAPVTSRHFECTCDSRGGSGQGGGSDLCACGAKTGAGAAGRSISP